MNGRTGFIIWWKIILANDNTRGWKHLQLRLKTYKEELLYIFIDEELWKEYEAVSTKDGPETYMSDGLGEC